MKTVGIDLGTTYSAVSHINSSGLAEIIPNLDGKRITPSVIWFADDEVIIGKLAKQNARAEPHAVVEYVKRYMGQTIEEFSREFNGKNYSADQISAELIKHLKREAEAQISNTIDSAVITVPAYFNDRALNATHNAGTIAGLNVLGLLHEPTAAAIAFGVAQAHTAQKALVFDLGGGTFDVTVLSIENEEIRVLAINGDHQLGGKDWDDTLIMDVTEQFEMKYGLDPLDDSATYQDLQLRAVEAKIQLSARQRAKIMVNYSGYSLPVNLTRQRFEALTPHLVERCRILTELAVSEGGLTKDDIDTVLLVGGSTRMPMIREMLTNYFGKQPNSSMNPDECVAIGAAIYADRIKPKLRGLRPSARYSRIKRISDVCPHSLGFAVFKNGVIQNSVIIPKNTNFPCEIIRDNYATSTENQDSIDIHVLQGESPDPRVCLVSGIYKFSGIPKRPAGESKLSVKFRYDENGIIEVSAIDQRSGKSLTREKKVEEVDWDALEDLSNVAPMDIALLIDCSGSMSGQELDDAKSAAKSFIDRVPSDAEIGVLSFGSDVRIQSNLTTDLGQLRAAIERIEASGLTPMGEAIALAHKQMLTDPDRIKLAILLTDGFPDDKSKTSDEAEIARAKDIRIISIGVGSGVDSEYLKTIASVSEDYYFVNESFELEETFETIATTLATEVSGFGKIQSSASPI